MARQYDIFYAQSDRGNLGETTPVAVNWSDVITLNGAQKVEYYATSLVVQSSNALVPLAWPYSGTNLLPLLNVGQRLILTDSADGTKIHLEVVQPFTNGTTLVVRPLHSGADVIDPALLSAAGHTFADNSTFATTWEDASVCVIDLREAPADERGYSYVLYCSGWANWFNYWGNALDSMTPVRISARMLGESPPSDPFVGDVFTESSATTGKAGAGQRAYHSTGEPLDGGIGFNFNAGGIVDLEPGGLYYFRFQFSVQDVVCAAQMHNARILALRFERKASTTFIATLYDSSGADTEIEGTGKQTSSVTWSAISGLNTYLAVNPSGTTGQQMCAGISCLSTDTANTAAVDAQVDLSQDAPDVVSTRSYFTPGSDDDNVPVGVLAMTSGNTALSTKVGTQQGGTINLTAAYGFMIYFAPLFLAELSDNLAGSAYESATTTDNSTWVEIAASTGSDFNTRAAGSSYLELWCTATGSASDTWDDFAYCQSRTPNAGVPAYSTSFSPVGRFFTTQYPDIATSNDDPRVSTANFLRSKYTTAYDATAEMSMYVLTPEDLGGADVSTYRPLFSVAKERGELVVAEGTPTSVVAQVDTGLVLKTGWAVSGGAWGDGSYTYCITLALTNTTIAPGGIEQILGGVNAVWRNGTKLTERTAVEFAAGILPLLDWAWIPSTRKLCLHMGGTSDNGSAPWDDDINIVGVVPIYYAREAENIVGLDGTTVPYTSRLVSIPGASAKLSSSNGIVTAAASIGSLVLANGDGNLDDLMVRRVWEGHGVKLLLGYPDASDAEADFTTYQTGTMAIPTSNIDTVTLRLFDRSLGLDKQLAGTFAPTGQVTIYTGSPADPTAVENHGLPVVYGRIRRIPAYRLTNTLGAADVTVYSFSSSQCYDATGAFVRKDSRESEAITLHASKSSAASGRVVFTNSVLASQVSGGASFNVTQIPDVVYVDVFGEETSAGDRPLLYPGEIIKHILKNAADSTTGLQEDEIDTGSLELLDRRWRARMGTVYDDPNAGSPTTTTANRFFANAAPATGGLFPDGTTLREAANEIAASVFAFLSSGRSGRVSVGVADYHSTSLAENGSFDAAYPQIGGVADTTANSMIWPWSTLNSATAVRDAAARYTGQFGCLLYNGTDYRASIEQPIELSMAGDYAVELLVVDRTANKGGSGTASKFRIALVLPDGSEVLGDVHALGASLWERITQKFSIPFGDAGQAKLRVYIYYGDDASDNAAKYIYLDRVSVYRIIAELTPSNADISGWEYDVEMYDAALSSYDITDGATNRIRIRATNNDAVGLYVTQNEASDTQPAAGTVTLDHQLYDATSAAGVSASVASYYSRQRLQLKVVAYTLRPARVAAQLDSVLEFRIPAVGDRVLVSGFTRIPAQFTDERIWRVDAVNYRGGTAQEVQMTLTQSVDPADRTEVR